MFLVVFQIPYFNRVIFAPAQQNIRYGWMPIHVCCSSQMSIELNQRSHLKVCIPNGNFTVFLARGYLFWIMRIEFNTFYSLSFVKDMAFCKFENTLVSLFHVKQQYPSIVWTRHKLVCWMGIPIKKTFLFVFIVALHFFFCNIVELNFRVAADKNNVIFVLLVPLNLKSRVIYRSSSRLQILK